MEKISVFNYEIYYLDFLEGSLSEEDTTLLFNFLDKHPEYKMDDDSLPTLNVESIKMTTSQKENLKQPLFSTEINENNIEYFLIAQAENLLSSTEEEALALFVSNNPHYLKDQKQFKAVYLKADESITFTHKENLKKKKVIVLWPYISIAASLVLGFLIWNNSQSSRIDAPSNQYAKKGTVKSSPQPKGEVEDEVEVENKAFRTVVPENAPTREHNNIPIAEQKVKKEYNVDSLPIRRSPNMTQSDHTPVLASYKQQELRPVTPEANFNVENNDNIAITTAMNDDDMVNPIQPITAYLGKKTNTIIEYKKQDRTEKQPKKLFIKVGKFEFYRKKH